MVLPSTGNIFADAMQQNQMSRALVSFDQASEHNETYHDANATPHRFGGGAIEEEKDHATPSEYAMKSAAKTRQKNLKMAKETAAQRKLNFGH